MMFLHFMIAQISHGINLSVPRETFLYMLACLFSSNRFFPSVHRSQ